MLPFDCAPGMPARIRRVCSRLPALEGAPVRIAFEGGEKLLPFGGRLHAGAFLRERRIVFGRELRHDRREFARIFVHEVFHFAWARLGNTRRRSWEALLDKELRARAGGELGWSAEWRKQVLSRRDRHLRTRRWREYCCESFCDTAAWIFSGIGGHGEFTLPAAARKRRRQWFEENIVTARISI